MSGDVKREVCVCSCGHRHVLNPRKIAITKDMVFGLKQVFEHCKRSGDYHFRRRDVKALFGANETLTATFGNLIYFGGILFKPDGKRGYWGINMQRAELFFANQLLVPEYVIKDPVTNVIEYSTSRVVMSNVKGIYDFLDANGDFKVEYV